MRSKVLDNFFRKVIIMEILYCLIVMNKFWYNLFKLINDFIYNIITYKKEYRRVGRFSK